MVDEVVVEGVVVGVLVGLELEVAVLAMGVSPVSSPILKAIGADTATATTAEVATATRARL